MKRLSAGNRRLLQKAKPAPDSSIRLTEMFFMSLILAALVFMGCAASGPSPELNAPYSEDGAQTIPVDYRIGPGDELEVHFQMDVSLSDGEYVINVQDTLRIEFYYYPKLNKTVKVRPDGFITLPKIGEVNAAGLKPLDLAEQIHLRFQPHITKPEVTVDVIDFNSRLESLKNAVANQQSGQSKRVVVSPDGNISLPLAKEIKAAGLTAPDLGQSLEHHYRQQSFNSISIAVAIQRARSNRVFIMGQVNRPNFYELQGPVTLTQLIATAGGFTKAANDKQVVVISRDSQAQPVAAVIDVDHMLRNGALDKDLPMKQHDVVFVPRTPLAQAALVGEQLWRLIPVSFTGNVTAGYNLGGKAAD